MVERAERRFFIQISVVFIAFLFLFVATPNILHAQSPLGGGAGVHLVSSPHFPGANTSVEISLDDYQLNTAGASITWYVDSVEQTAFKDTRSITMKTGDLGKKSTVSVILSRVNAAPLTASLTLMATEVHIILETDTYVPNFYKGRALPSVESTVRAVAVVQDGTKSLPGTYTYRWTEENTVLFGGPVKGKYAYLFTMPRYGSKRLSVDVTDATGKSVGEGAIELRATQPELHFYEQSPLRGLSQKEVARPLPFIGEETTVYGEPYFLNASMRNEDATFNWKINSLKTAIGQDTPNAITLQRIGDRGQSQVSFEIITRQKIPQLINGVFDLVW